MERTVKQIAESVGLPSRTIRYYDRIGLVSPAERSESGYRLYGPEDEGKLRFVRQAKGLGLSLEEIRGLIAAAERGSCGEVVPELGRVLDDKMAEVDRQIAELQEFRERLGSYRAGRGAACGCDGHGAFCGCLAGAPMIQVDTKKKEGPMAEDRCSCGCCGPAQDEDARRRPEAERLEVVRVQERIAELEERLAKLELQTTG